MKRSISLALSTGLLLLFAAGCPKSQEPEHAAPSPSKVKEEPPKLSGKAKEALILDQAPEVAGEMPDWDAAFSHQITYDGQTKAVVVRVELRDGFHAYTVGETIGKPLELRFADASGYGPEGEIAYPKGETKDLPIGKSVIVEGKAEIVAKIAKKKDSESKKVEGKFRYQVCTEEACDRPRTVDFALDVPEA